MYINPFTTTVSYAKLVPNQPRFSLNKSCLPFYFTSVSLKETKYYHGIVKTILLIQECLFMSNFESDVGSTSSEILSFSLNHLRFAERKQLELKFQQMYWILGGKSELSIENKLMINKTILKPNWT
jgi:hypothetical protein